MGRVPQIITLATTETFIPYNKIENKVLDLDMSPFVNSMYADGNKITRSIYNYVSATHCDAYRTMCYKNINHFITLSVSYV